MLPVPVSVPTLPAASVMVAVTVYAPSGKLLDVACHDPSAKTVAVKLCESPLLSTMLRFTTVPAGSVEVPLKVGVLSLPRPLSFTVTTGLVVSILPVAVTLLVLPASSLMVTATV